MSVRKRKWMTRAGEAKEAWIVDYVANGSRHIETFERKKELTLARPRSRSTSIRASTRRQVKASRLRKLPTIG
jgi:hypothetical protein